MPYLHGVDIITAEEIGRPITIPATNIIGLIGTAPDADATAFPVNTPVVITSAAGAAKLDPNGVGDGTLMDAIDAIYDQTSAVVVVVRVTEGADEAATTANIVGNATTKTGVHAFVAAESLVGRKPKILIAPGWTHQYTAAKNAVAAELEVVADKLRARIIIDGPNTTDAALLSMLGDYDNPRVMVVDGFAQVQRGATVVSEPMSGRVAGILASLNYWESPGNKPVKGILAPSRPIDYSLTDATAQAHALIDAGAMVLVNSNGLRIMGNKVPSSDSRIFCTDVAIDDVIAEAIGSNIQWALALPFNTQLVNEVVLKGREFLAGMVQDGAIYGFDIWADPDINDAAALQAGRFYVNANKSRTRPVDRITITVAETADYLDAVI